MRDRSTRLLYLRRLSCRVPYLRHCLAASPLFRSFLYMHVRSPPISLIFNTDPSSSCLPFFHITSYYSPLPILSSHLSENSLASSPSPSMAGTAAATVCSMCGDVGFPEKLFRCARCRHRFQHSYCTNYYGDGASASAGSDTCDWCLSDVGAGKQARWSSSAAGKQQHATGSQESSSTTSSGGSGRGGGKASGGDHHQAEVAGRRATTRTAGRRYKLLKDVLC